jgi:hypothetical protein
MSAQWKGALTLSGMAFHAPHCPGVSGDDDLPGGVVVCGTHDLVLCELAAQGKDRTFVDRQNGSHRSHPRGHGLLHRPASRADQSHRVFQGDRFRRDERRIFAERMPRAECGRGEIGDALADRGKYGHARGDERRL